MTLSVLDAARDAPDQIALIVGERQITFAELGASVARRIAWLRERGVDGHDARPVALAGTSRLPALELVYALMELGQPQALVHPRLTETERRATAEVVQPSLYVDEATATEAAADAVVTNATAPVPSSAMDPERWLAVLFTSGTTGSPKGIALSRRAFVASARASEANLGFRDDDRWLLGLPIAHVGGLSILTRCLLARKTVVVPDAVAEGRRLDATSLIASIEATRTTLVSLVPTQLEWLLAEPGWSPPPFLRAVLLGGAAARPSLLERAAERGLPVLTTYGLTEACSQVTTQPAGTVNRGERGAGAPMFGTEVRIVEGAIQVRGPTLLSALVPAGVGSVLDDDGWFHTDDLGRLDEVGHLHVLGRRSDLIVTGGENVYPAEVEAILERCPGVDAACIFGVPDDTWGELVAVALVPGESGAPADGDLLRFVREHLAQHRRPRLVALINAFETTPAGKLDRRATARRAALTLRKLG